VIADLAGRYASVSEIPSFDDLGKRVRVALASSTVAVNTVQQARDRSGGRKKKWVPHGKCKHCGQYGHKHDDCPKKPQEVANVQILSPYVNTTSVKTKNFLWDSGSQIHVTNDCSLFSTFVNKPLPAVSLGGHKIPATGIGSIPFKRPDGTSFTIDDVWLTPSGHVNVLTPNQFLGAGYHQGPVDDVGGSFFNSSGDVLLNFVCKPNFNLPIVDAIPE
ncbi:hypothetical protein OIO90_006643, partial [Microbotryomycetes sp. JL221]